MIAKVTVVGTWPFATGPVERCARRLADAAAVEASSTMTAEGQSTAVGEAVVAAIEEVERDPAVHTVGIYSFPNSDGVLQLDAAVMADDGRSGAVLGITGFDGAIRGAWTLAQARTHPILACEGASRWLAGHGLPRGKDTDPPVYTPPQPGTAKTPAAPAVPAPHSHDTVGIVAVANGILFAGCSTSGIRGKLAGRIGDSPIFGAGLYAAHGVGAASATGDGDLICRIPLSFLAVEGIRRGLDPTAACVEALARLAELPGYNAAKTEAAVIAVSVSGQCGHACTAALQGRFVAPTATVNSE